MEVAVEQFRRPLIMLRRVRHPALRKRESTGLLADFP